MAEELRPTERTAITPQALYSTLRAAWRALIGGEPTREQLLVIMAQWALETNNGAASNNWNLGGIKHVPGDGHDYARYATREFLHGVWETLDQDFRAYDSLEHGTEDYLFELHTRFEFAWPAVLAGDVQDFAVRLKARGYFTAPLGQYRTGLLTRWHWLDSVIGRDTQPELATTADEVLEVVKDERSIAGPIVEGQDDADSPAPPEEKT